MTKRERERANKVLDGIAAITKNEMLKFGEYLSDKVVDQKLAESGALCGGRTACLVGSAYLAARVPLEWDEWEDPTTGKVNKYAYLPHVDVGCREPILSKKPALRNALAALDAAATKWADKEGIYFDSFEGSPAEGLFEDDASPYNGLPYKETRKAVLRLIRDARKELAAA